MLWNYNLENSNTNQCLCNIKLKILIARFYILLIVSNDCWPYITCTNDSSINAIYEFISSETEFFIISQTAFRQTLVATTVTSRTNKKGQNSYIYVLHILWLRKWHVTLPFIDSFIYHLPLVLLDLVLLTIYP